MDSTLDLLITYFRMYGVPVLAGAVLLQSNGIPTGANFLVIAAGAFAYAGEFNIAGLFAWVWLFNIVGDSLGYYIWNGFGARMLEKMTYLERLVSASLLKSAHYLEKYGQSSLFITRFPVSGLGPPMNFLTGLTGYGYRRFLVAIIPGEFVWTAFNLGMGYWFGDSWETIGIIMNHYLSWILSISGLVLVVYMLYKMLRNHNHRQSKVTISENETKRHS